MPLPLKKTLGEIRSDIQTRLGFGMAGQAGVVNSSLIDSMIRSAQEQIYEQYDILELKRVDERLTGASQQYYDYPADCNVDRIIGIWVKWGGKFYPLEEGINFSDRSSSAANVPQKYERRDQIEVWPVPLSNIYTLRTEFVSVLLPLVANSDRTSIASQLVYLHALSQAKAHYRQPDAQIYANQLDVLLDKLKARNRGKSIWEKSTARSPYDLPLTPDQQV